MPVAFDCECGERWWSPPRVCCSSCGPAGASVPDPVIWSVGAVPGTSISISAQLRDGERFAALCGSGFDRFVDVAGAGHYVWRPDDDTIRERAVDYIRVEQVEDTNVDLPDFAFDAVADALDSESKTLVFCAAGLKWSPHLVYGVLRQLGLDAERAWASVVAARPFVDRWEPYVAAAERWLAART